MPAAKRSLDGTTSDEFNLGEGGTHGLRRDGNDLRFEDPNNTDEPTLSELKTGGTVAIENVLVSRNTGESLVSRNDGELILAG